MECPVCGGLGYTEETQGNDILFPICDYCEGIGSVEESEG